MMQGVVVIGAHGRLGSFAAKLLEEHLEFHVAARVGRLDDLATSLEGLSGAVALEVTRAGLGARHATLCVRAGLPTVVGTSGVSDAQVEELDRLARERGVGVLVQPNFSRGAALLARLARHAAEVFPDVELVEHHRPEKRDAPSGTARSLGSELQALTGRSVPLHSVRLPGQDATHELIFGGRGETLRLSHEAHGLEAYADGLIDSLRVVSGFEGARQGWCNVLGSKFADS